MTSIEIPITLDIRTVDPARMQQGLTIFREEMLLALQDIGLHVSERVKGIITGDGVWYTGTLLNSITWSLFMETAAVLGVIVGTNVTYAKYQEYGTIPHFVPFHMAKSLYDQAISDWGYIKVTPKVSTRLNASPGKGVSKGPGGYSQITGKHQTYLTKHPERLWLQSKPGGKPLWGVVVSGKKQPFVYPGWEQSVPYAERRLLEAAQRAATRISGGG